MLKTVCVNLMFVLS